MRLYSCDLMSVDDDLIVGVGLKIWGLELCCVDAYLSRSCIEELGAGIVKSPRVHPCVLAALPRKAAGAHTPMTLQGLVWHWV